MLQNKIFQLAVFSFAAILLLWWLVFFGQSTPSPDWLAEHALSNDEESLREASALELARHPEKPIELLRKVFKESSSDRVRAAVATGLGITGDWDSIPDLLKAMESEEPHLRGKAYVAVCKITSQDFGPFTSQPKEYRDKIIHKISTEWPILYKGYQIKQQLLKEGKQPIPNPNDPTDKNVPSAN